MKLMRNLPVRPSQSLTFLSKDADAMKRPSARAGGAGGGRNRRRRQQRWWWWCDPGTAYDAPSPSPVSLAYHTRAELHVVDRLLVADHAHDGALGVRGVPEEEREVVRARDEQLAAAHRSEAGAVAGRGSGEGCNRAGGPWGVAQRQRCGRRSHGAPSAGVLECGPEWSKQPVRHRWSVLSASALMRWPWPERVRTTLARDRSAGRRQRR